MSDQLIPRYISTELFHFVGRSAPLDHERNYAVLRKVFSEGCISHPPHEVGGGTNAYTLNTSKELASEEMFVPTVTCYCDIPYEQIGPHIQKYGSFGLSFSRHHLTKLGARPVTYVPCRPDDWWNGISGYELLKEFEATFLGVREHRSVLCPDDDKGKRVGIGLGTRPTTVAEALDKAEHTLAVRVLAFIKPYDSTLEDSDPKYYYAEREWRKLANLMFKPEVVLRVVVHPSFLSRARADLPGINARLCTV